MSPYDRLKELGITLPAPVSPVAAFVPFVRTGNLLLLSGQIARKDGKSWRGQLGADVTTEQGVEAARGIAIDLLATLHAAAGDLSLITRIVKLLVLVNSHTSFDEPHKVADGCSILLRDVLGDAGVHARSAIGVAQLPLGSCVEIELIAEVRDAA